MSISLDGYTYCHEHLHIDLSSQKRDEDCLLDSYASIRDELLALKQYGVLNLIEMTNRFMGRNPHFIENIMQDTGMNILMSTGYYIEGFFPEKLYRMSAREICGEIVHEITVGIDDSVLKASVIGEIGSSENAFTETERKVFEAAAMAHYETGRPISTHLSMSTMAREQVKLFKSYAVAMERVTIGHCDLKNNLDDILWLIEQGCHVQFDTIGKNSYFPDSSRINMLKELASRNLLDRVMLSMDITRKSHLKKNGGLGFCYLVESFIPQLLESGISKTQIEQMLRLTPYHFFK
ncbi:phosphotriesterase family protein [Aeromonas veronii]